MENNRNPRVFISYAHESDELRQSVASLAQWLRDRGVAVVTDHLFENCPPEEGWPNWMEKQINKADFVFIVCTELYYKRFMKEDETDRGKGATWEGAIITQKLYEKKLINNKFYPILPDCGSDTYIPDILKAFDHYCYFPSNNEKILRLIEGNSPDPNDNLPAFQKRQTARLTGADDTRLAPNKKNVYGREAEISQVCEFIRSTEKAAQVFAAVTGTGGIGKTEVCKAALKRVLSEGPTFPAFFISFTSATSGDNALSVFAKSMGIENPSSFEEVAVNIPEGLYYLDNLETIADDKTGIEFLRKLAARPGVRILTSSRVSISFGARNIVIDKLPPDAAVALFTESWNGIPLPTDGSLGTFVQKELGGHPLTIVLVAGLGEGYSLADIQRQWKEIGVELAQNPYDEDRLGNLSISLLLTARAVNKTPKALTLWGIIAIFAEGMRKEDLDIFMKILETNDTILRKLIRHHIITRRNDVYEILPPIARYALDSAVKENDGFDWQSIREAYYRYFLPIAEAASPIASIDTALSARQKVTRILYTWLEVIQRERKGENIDMTTLRNANSYLFNIYQFDILISIQILHVISELFKNKCDDMALAETQNIFGDLETRLGNIDAARSLYQSAAGLYMKIRSDLGLANILKSLGDLEKYLGEYEKAYIWYQKAIELFTKEQDDLGLANIFQSLGDIKKHTGKFEQVRSLYKKAAKLYKNLKHNVGLAITLYSLGDIEAYFDNTDEARLLYQDAAELFTKEQDDLGLANTFNSLGNLEIQCKNIDKAYSLYEKAIKLFVKEQNPTGLAYTYISIAVCHHLLSQSAEAVAAIENAKAAAEQSNLPPVIDYVNKVIREMEQ